MEGKTRNGNLCTLIAWKPIQRGRKVVAVRFTFHRAPKAGGYLSEFCYRFNCRFGAQRQEACCGSCAGGSDTSDSEIMHP